MKSYINTTLSNNCEMLRNHKHCGLSMSVLLVSTLCLFLSSSVFGEVLSTAGFENGDFISDGWGVSGSKNISIKSKPSPVCSGDFSAEFSLNTKYSMPYRTELTGGRYKNFKVGSEYWIGFAIYIPNDWKVDKSRASDEVVWQLHGSPDKNLGEGYRNPSMSLKIHENSWVLRRGWCAKNSQAKVCNNVTSEHKTIGKLETGKWTNFVLHFKLSYKNDGLIELWQDDKSPIKLSGPNSYNDAKDPYMKFGLYKSSWKDPARQKASGFSSRKLYFDSLVVGNKSESRQSVVPKCGKLSNLSPNKLSPPTKLSIK